MKVRLGHLSGKRGRLVGAGVVAVAAGVVAWAAARWWPHDLRPGWTGTEQAALVAEFVGAAAGVLGLAVAFLAWLRPRPPRSGGLTRLRGPQVIGRIPQPAAWFQPREAGERLGQAAGKGRTAVLTQVVSGMGGVGKTQLAADFARKLADRGQVDLLVWITASSTDAIIAGYAEAAAILGLTNSDSDAQRAAQQFLAWAERTPRRWLAVLDDLVRPGDLAGWWPPAGRSSGRVVVTTRRRDAALQAEGRVVVDVDLFTKKEARRYLAQALPGHQPAERDRLAADLGYLPLALAQAATYVRDRGLSCGQYRERLADHRRKLRNLLPEDQALPDEQQATVAAIWSLSIDAASELNPEGVARPVLELAAVLDPNGIPAAIFATKAAALYLTAATGRQVTADDASDALHNLKRLSLLTTNPNEPAVRVHALVQRATRDSLADEQTDHVARAAAVALLQAWPDVERDPVAGASLRANAAALRKNTGEALLTPEVHLVLFRAGASLGETGQVTAARDYLEHLLDDSLRVLGQDHPDVLRTRGVLTRWRGEAGDAAGAVHDLQALLGDMVRVLGPDHPDTLTTRGNLARWRGEGGDLVGAIEALQALLADELRVLGADHPDTLKLRHNLAHYQGAAGDAVGAAQTLRELRRDQVRVLGPDHPDTMTTRGNLAAFQGEAGDPAGASDAFQALLKDRQRLLGADHPDTLTTRGSLARWKRETGDLAGATEVLQALLADQLRVLGPDHPDTLITRGSLADLQMKTGDPAGAVEQLQTLLDDVVRVLGPDHPDTLTNRNNLAVARGEAGDAVGAAEAFQALTEDRMRTLGPDHPHTLTSRNNLAHWLAMAGDPAGALQIAETLLQDLLRVLGPDHPSTLRTRGNLAGWRGEAGDAAGAAQSFQALLHDMLRVLGPEHPDTLRTRGNLAGWRGEAADAAGAAQELQALLEDRLRVLGPDHPDTLTTLIVLSHWRSEAGQ